MSKQPPDSFGSRLQTHSKMTKQPIFLLGHTTREEREKSPGPSRNGVPGRGTAWEWMWRGCHGSPPACPTAPDTEGPGACSLLPQPCLGDEGLWPGIERPARVSRAPENPSKQILAMPCLSLSTSPLQTHMPVHSLSLVPQKSPNTAISLTAMPYKSVYIYIYI